MFEWIAGLFSSSKTADNLLDKNDGLLAQAGEWIGNLSYTDEEKAEARERINSGLADFVKTTLTENTARSKTRRAVAIMWISCELLLVILTCAVAPFNSELAKFYWVIATSDLMFWGTMSVIGFFFGPYMIGSHFGNSNKNGA